MAVWTDDSLVELSVASWVSLTVESSAVLWVVPTAEKMEVMMVDRKDGSLEPIKVVHWANCWAERMVVRWGPD